MPADYDTRHPTAHPSMKAGFATVLWGCRIDDIVYALDVIAACGFRGVEFAQHHEEIFIRCDGFPYNRPLNDAAELRRLLDDRGLELIGLVSGSLRDRMQFLGHWKSPYLYLDRWREGEAVEALEAGYKLALHPHWLMPLRKARQVREIVERYAVRYPGRVRMILDTADSFIAEDDPAQVAKEYHRFIEAVHLKDWKPDYGRWSHRYAHGFCIPGEGIVCVGETMDALHSASFGGWILMEQDHYARSREETVEALANWIKNNGLRWNLGVTVDDFRLESLKANAKVNPFNEKIGVDGVKKFVFEAIGGKRNSTNLFLPPFSGEVMAAPLSELMLGRELARRLSRSPDASEFYWIISSQIRLLTGSECVKVWSYNPLIGDEGHLCLLGMDAPGFESVRLETILKADHAMAGTFLDGARIRQFDLRDPSIGGKYGDQGWLMALRERAPWFIVLPIFNTSNNHQLRYLVTIASERSLLADTGPDQFDREQSFDRLSQFDAISWIVSHWADYLTDEICSCASGATNHICGTFRQSSEIFLKELRDYLKRAFDCNEVTIFLENATGDRLEPATFSESSLEWEGSSRFYDLTDTDRFTLRAWRGREMVFSNAATTGKAREKNRNGDGRNEILFAPLVRRNGKCHGVVRLHNKRSSDKRLSSMFTDDDAAKLDAIIQTALPHLELLMEKEHQLQALARMMHEFQVPLVAIRGAVDLMKTDLRNKGHEPERFFSWDLLDDVWQWSEIMGRYTRNARFFTIGHQRQPLRVSQVSLLADIVMPVLRQIRPLVPKGVKFDAHQELGAVPRLWLDRGQMQQVFFNLLSNAIKYRTPNSPVRAEISGGVLGNTVTAFIQDWGQGIEESEKEEIFRPGVRGIHAERSDVVGQGFGCYVCREIIEAHGGRITVRSCSNPTTFEISLPLSLKTERPKRTQS